MTVKELLNEMTDENKTKFKNDLLRVNILQGENEIFCDGFYDFVQAIPYAYCSKLFRNCGDFETLFQSVGELLAEHTQWCRVRSYMWEKQLRTVAVRYNLIHNTDKTQEETISELTSSTSGSSGSTETAGATTNMTDSSVDNLHQISAANQTDFHNKNKDVVTEFTTGTVSSNEHAETKNEYSDEKESKIIHKIRAYGNIGVTTNQQMLKEERESALFDIVSVMVNDFKKEFCIMVY